MSSSDPGNDIQVHIRRLLDPGADKKVTRFEANQPRREAADALGRLKDPKAIPALAQALEDESATLRVRAIAALGQIGGEGAAKTLVTQLGDGTMIRNKALGAWAAEALHANGQGRIADAVRGALLGDMSQLSDGVGPYRLEVMEALVTALNRPSIGDPMARHAAVALRTLGLVEALPRMREALLMFRERSPTGWEITEAIRELEELSSLPRPHNAQETTDTLPRRVEDPGEGA